jgi:hypothetical protein
VQMSALARRLGISESYLSQQLGGTKTLTGVVARALRDVLGDDAWHFVIGERDDLPAPPRELRTRSSADAP